MIFEEFRTQERQAVLLNLGVLLVLSVVHAVFLPVLGDPSIPLLAVLVGYLAFQGLVLLWLLRARKAPRPRVLRLYMHCSIWGTLAFASIASALRTTVDSHYTILMVPAIIAAAFRFSLRGMLVVVFVAAALTLYESYAYFLFYPPGVPGELFEAVTISLMFLVVGLVVWSLASRLRRDRQRLQDSVDELERTRDRLVAEEKLAAIGRLSSSIAHEIRNPVAMISSSLAAAHAAGTCEDSRTRMFEIAGAEAARLGRITDEFLAYARPPSLHVAPTTADALCAYAEDVIRAHAESRGVSIVREPGRAIALRCDPFQVHQALLNLLLNAVDASAPDATVLFGSETRDDQVVLWVENAGEPISEDNARKIFEPFFTTKNRGTGLGLAIARSIAQAHGGELRLALNKPGRVRFELSLHTLLET